MKFELCLNDNAFVNGVKNEKENCAADLFLNKVNN